MKKSIISLFAVLLAITTFGQTNKRPYAYKSAYIEYELSGNTTGKQTLYIDNWGWNRSETIHSVTKMLGQKTETHQRNVTIQFDSYQWVPGEKTGTKVHNQWLEDLMNDPTFDMEKFGEKTLEALNFRKTGTETIQGKVCDVWKSDIGSTSWVWNNIAVKTELKFFGTKQVMTATKIEIDASVPESEFDIPSDIKFTETSLDPSQMNFEGIPEDGESQSDTTNKEGVPEIKSFKDLKGLLKKSK
jgi:hypothetical protein